MLSEIEMAYNLLSRENPALQPRAADERHAISKMAAAGWAAAIFVQLGTAELARCVIDLASPIDHAAVAKDIVIGSGRRSARDHGGHYGLALRAARSALLQECDHLESRAGREMARLWAMAWPKSLKAVRAFRELFVLRLGGALLDPQPEDQLLRSAIWYAEEAYRDEWEQPAPAEAPPADEEE